LIETGNLTPNPSDSERLIFLKTDALPRSRDIMSIAPCWSIQRPAHSITALARASGVGEVIE